MKDFFISYNKADKPWAEWIAWTLEEAGYSVVIQAWDFRPGENFALKMQEAAKGTRQTIAVLSEHYLNALYTQPEWAAAFARDPKGERRILLPIRIKECQPEGLLGPTIYIDLVGRTEEEARGLILEGLKDRAKPNEPPAFPQAHENATISNAERVITQAVQYPGTSANDASDSTKPGIPWNVPIGIPFFTGRRDVLTQLHNALKASGLTALAQRQAISGLGGIGKTQTAIEYADRHRDEYKAVLWAVAESRESLISDFVAIAGVLNLPEVNVQDQTFTVKAVKRWLEANTDWLLILDNADNPSIVEEFLPENSNGHLLLTSRAQVFDNLGILNPVELEEMTPEDAITFLLKRTGRDAIQSNESQAVEELAQELDYLPLALEQAGAYIKELRGSFQDYLASYRQRGLELLEKGHLTGKYRKSVRTTWSLNFQQIEQTSLASADLLRVSAFLNPDRIPAELFRLGGVELGPKLSVALANVATDPLALDEVLRPLIQYSLIHRDRESKTYDIHRLVQAVLKDGMDETTRQRWVKRVVKAMARAIPDVDVIDPSEWERIERLLPHAHACSELVKTWNLDSHEVAYLLNLTGRYLHRRGRLRGTESLYEASLAIREKILGPDHPDVATSLHNQAWLYNDQGEYKEAEPLLLKSLAIREQLLGREHADIAISLDMLGRVYVGQGRYIEADRLYRRSLEIREKILGPDHPDTTINLNNLAGLYILQGKYADAEPLLVRTLEVLDKIFGPDYYELANVLNELASVYFHQRKPVEAEALFLRSITIREKTFGTNYPLLAASLNNLANIYIEDGKYIEAESVLTRSLNIREAELSPDHPDVAYSLSGFAYLYRSQGKYTEAESLYLRSLEIREKSLGHDHPSVAHSLVILGQFYRDQRNYSKGEPLLRRAIPILKKVFGAENPHVVHAMLVHSILLKGLNRKGEAQRLEAQATKIQAKLKKKKMKR